MFCRRCGIAIEDDSSFCRHCGVAQSDVPAGPAPAEATPRTHKVWMLVGGLVLLAGIAMTAFGLKDVRAFNYTMIRSGTVIGAIGFAIFITAKLLAWWRTG